MKTVILIISLSVFFYGCSSDSSTTSKSDNITNSISDIVATFSSYSSVDGEWNEGADEEIQQNVVLRIVENDKLFYCYDSESLLKVEIYGSIYKASIEYVQRG